MIIKTSELTGPALDWAVAKAVGYSDWVLEVKRFLDMHAAGHYNYSTDWSQGGPIIERERIKAAPNLNSTWLAQIRHEKSHPLVAHKVLAGWTNRHGPTPLIAAMRCLVASKLGESVDIPYELGAQA